MLRQLTQRAPIQPVQIPEWQQRGIDVSMWRLDQIDTAAPGNKIFKLDENLRAARGAGYQRVLSFGGVFSNHLHALALAGAAQGFNTVGIVRGEAAAADNPTLRDAVAAGMQLQFVDRADYRSLSRATHADELPSALQAQFGDCFVIPEGGANQLGINGCKVLGEVLAERAEQWDQVVLPCGTGTTLAGLVAGAGNACNVLGIAVLKGAGSLTDNVHIALAAMGAEHCTHWSIDGEHHGGGYARVTPALEQFIGYFQQHSGISIEPVYSGKMLYAIHSRIERGDFARGTRLLALHTGGLQGARGFSFRNNQRKDKAAIQSVRRG
jgi:1-aminocyclopropane-1-carboxylate deaminase